QPEGATQVVGDAVGVRVRHETPAGDTAGGVDQVLAGQQPQRLPYGAAADPEQAGEFRLAGQPGARGQRAGQDLLPELVGDLPVGGGTRRTRSPEPGAGAS